MHRCAFVVCIGLLMVWNFGCSPAPKKGAPTIKVKGTVNLDGKPMPSGEIRFSVAGEVNKEAKITDGTFSGEGYEGKNKVEIYIFKAGLPLDTDPDKKPTQVNTLPPQFNATSKLSADVLKGGTNDFKFEVTSK